MVWLFTHAGHQGVGAHLRNEHKTCCPLLGLRDRKTAAIKQDRTGQVYVLYMKIVMLEILNFFHKALAIVFPMSIFQ